jgi:glycosyltransferase involved in cell wall biosynthesis
MKNYFSIVIPTLNESKFLPNLLADLSKQINKDFEVLVVDGSSIDKTAVIAGRFKANFDLKVIKTKKGVSLQRNLGIKKSQDYCEYILFIDADCRLNRDFLVKLKKQLENKKPDLISFFSKTNSKHLKAKFLSYFYNLGFSLSKLINKPHGGGVIGVKASFIKEKGVLFDEEIEFCEDRLFMESNGARTSKYILFKKLPFIMNMRKFEKWGYFKEVGDYLKKNIELSKSRSIHREIKYRGGGEWY